MTHSNKGIGIKYAFFAVLLGLLAVLPYTVPPPVGV
jgi:hypothetical protein